MFLLVFLCDLACALLFSTDLKRTQTMRKRNTSRWAATVTTTRFLRPMMKTTARKQQQQQLKMRTSWKPYHHHQPANARSTPAPTASHPPRNRLHRLLSEPFRQHRHVLVLDDHVASGVFECCSECDACACSVERVERAAPYLYGTPNKCTVTAL